MNSKIVSKIFFFLKNKIKSNKMREFKKNEISKNKIFVDEYDLIY